jgi:hypothetical protein
MKTNKIKPRKSTTKGVRYKVTNWSEYNRSLKNRGSLTIWLSEEAIASWYYQGKKQKGAQFIYSEMCIETCCILRKVYHLPYRQTEGFMKSIVGLMKIEIKVPDYSNICRRNKSLHIKDVVIKSKKENLHIVVDSTGLKVYGEGEWKVRQHGYGKHRTWRKLHIAVDPDDGIILASELTTNSVDDASIVKPLLNDIQATIKKFGGDGAYDKTKVYDVLEKEKIKPIIPPRKNARIKKHGNSKGRENPRDKTIRYIRKYGRKKWKKKSHYHKRSIAETTMFRFKTILGDKLQTRTIERQMVESKLSCKILNRMNLCGMPVSIKLT